MVCLSHSKFYSTCHESEDTVFRRYLIRGYLTLPNFLSFIKARKAHFGLKSLKKSHSFCCTGLLCSKNMNEFFYSQFHVESNELIPSF